MELFGLFLVETKFTYNLPYTVPDSPNSYQFYHPWTEEWWNITQVKYRFVFCLVLPSPQANRAFAVKSNQLLRTINKNCQHFNNTLWIDTMEKLTNQWMISCIELEQHTKVTQHYDASCTSRSRNNTEQTQTICSRNRTPLFNNSTHFSNEIKVIERHTTNAIDAHNQWS